MLLNCGYLKLCTLAISVFRFLGCSGASSFSLRNMSNNSPNDLAGALAFSDVSLPGWAVGMRGKGGSGERFGAIRGIGV